MQSTTAHIFLSSVAWTMIFVAGLTVTIVLGFRIQRFFSRIFSGGRKQTGERVYRTCIKCDNGFYLTPIEVSFYSSHGRPLPKVCRDCKADTRREPEERRIANF